MHFYFLCLCISMHNKPKLSGKKCIAFSFGKRTVVCTQGEQTRANQYVYRLLLSFTTKFCLCINFITKKKEKKKWKQANHMQSLAGVWGTSQGQGAAPGCFYKCGCCSLHLVPGLRRLWSLVLASSIPEATKRASCKGKYLSKLHPTSISSLPLSPTQLSACFPWPCSAFIFLLCVFYSSETIRSLSHSLPSPRPHSFRRRTAEQKVAESSALMSGFCFPDC